MATNPNLRILKCPSCQASLPANDTDRTIRCQYCGAVVDVSGAQPTIAGPSASGRAAAASRKARKQSARESALERTQQATLMRNAAIAIVAIFVVGAGIFYVANETRKGIEDEKRPEANPSEQVIPSEGAQHVTEGSPLIFQHYPPSSGSHYSTPAQPGFYDEPISEGYWIHSLEHGNVVILYNCPDGCPDLKAKIRSLIANAPRRRCDLVRILAVPYSQGMAAPITVVAWGRQLDLVEFDQQAILNFYKRYEDRGPELIPCQ